MKKLLCVLALLILGTTAFISMPKTDAAAAKVYSAATYSAPCCTPCRSIRVTATEKIKVQPDVAYIHLSVETKDTNLETAKSNNAERTAGLITILKENNILEDDIKTTGFYVFPEYFLREKNAGYRVINQLCVKTKELGNIGKIIDQSTETGANIINGVKFTLEDYNSVYNTALTNAVVCAKEKAAQISKEINAEDIKIISVCELSSNYCYTLDMNHIHCDKYITTPIICGDIEIIASVELIFEIAA